MTERFQRFLPRDDVVVLLADSIEEPAGFAFVTYRPTLRAQGIDTATRRFYERHGCSNFETDTETRMLLYLRQLSDDSD